MPLIVRCAYNRAQGTGVDRKAMNFRSLGLLLLLGCTVGVAHADGLSQPQPVMLNVWNCDMRLQNSFFAMGLVRNCSTPRRYAITASGTS